ncbi:MAG: SoxR reducing system RseC family protein [Mariprofundaceae bacterium]
MRQTMTVAAVQGDQALLAGRRASACGGCAGKAACGTLGGWVDRGIEIRVANRLGARVGERVQVEAEDGAILRLSALLYGLPMAAFLLAGGLALAGARAVGMPGTEGWAALAATLAALGSWPWAMRLARRRMPRVRMVAIEGECARLREPRRAVH